ncbi:MAG: TRAP transporter substrate-binding protein DctP, partial [Sporichthyaceae bacterium]|nr:TRAP transporter substrate-binding protein DctP [Sporichthyaceae bacterium]
MIRLEVAHEWGGLAADAEQQVVQAVVSGDVDVAWVGTRVFDTLGVNSFQALTAPLLVDGYALQQAIIDSEIPDQMVNGLGQVGVMGLAVLAGGLRRPIAVRGPLLGPPDWQGLTVQTFRSNVQADTIRALGATPTDVGPTGRDAGLSGGQIHGFENSMHIYSLNLMHSIAPYVTANVVLWPETTVLLASPGRFARLSDQHQRWLRDAAADAAAQSSRLASVDTGLVADACRGGARLAAASAAQRAALREAVGPIYQRMSQDPQTKAYIARIEQLKTAVRADGDLAIPAGCTGDSPLGAEPSAGADDPSIINGIYRLEWTVDELVAAGMQRQESRDNAGVITLTFDNGQWGWSSQGRWSCLGTYSIMDGRFLRGGQRGSLGGVWWPGRLA